MLSAYGYGEVLIVEGITPIILFFTARYTDDSAEYVPRKSHMPRDRERYDN